MKTEMFIRVFFICVLVSTFGMLSCTSNREQVSVSESEITKTIDSMRLNLDFTSVDTLKILYTTNEEAQVLVDDAKVKSQIEKMLTLFVNDTAWNNSGIMVKMVAPDYMLVLHHTVKAGMEDNWVSVWKELGKAKVADKWYLLPENKNDLFILLDNLK